MIDENKLSKEAGRGLQAKSLANNDLLNEAFANLERAYVERWRSTNIDDMTGREKLFLAINVVGKVKQHLQSIINDGKLAEMQLADLAKPARKR